MYNDQFEVRVARVRHRFALALPSKIETTLTATERMSSNDGVKYISNSYRHLHSIYGVGATVGFAATGEAANAAKTALTLAYHEKRALTEMEVARLKKALAHLRDVAALELRTMYQRGH
jgi:chemotaxis protein histidine kinase CheA